MKKNTVSIAVEDFAVQNVDSASVTVHGVALPFDVISRNGFTYEKESIKAQYHTLRNKPVLFNHDPEKVIGHVKEVRLSGEGMLYEMDVGDDGPYGWVSNKLKRKDLNSVSIQCIYDEDKSYIDENGVTHAYISEFLELSVVSIPGFADTTTQVVEHFKTREGDSQMAEEDPKKKVPAEEEVDEEQPKDKPEAEKAKEQDEEPKDDEPSKMEAIVKQVASLKAELDKVKQMIADKDKEEESSDEEDDKSEEADDEEDEKKVEEAIRKDKATISTESYQSETKELTAEDLKEVWRNI